MRLRRSAVAALAALVLATPLSAPVDALEAAAGACRAGPVDPSSGEGVPQPTELIWWSHTPVRAQVGNGRLTATLDEDGRVIGLLWPNATIFDHTGGALGFQASPQWQDGGMSPAAGLRWGVRVDGRFSWLGDRGWESTISYRSDDSNVAVIRAYHARWDVAVDIEVTVATDADVLAQRVVVRDLRGEPRDVQLVWYENLTPTERALPLATSSISDTLLEPEAEFARVDDATIVHSSAGVDAAFALGGKGADAAIVGVDTCGAGRGVSVEGERVSVDAPVVVDAYDASVSGRFTAFQQASGRVNGALAWNLSLSPGGSSALEAYLAAAPDVRGVRELFERAVRQGFSAIAAAADRHWRRWVARARVPDAADLPASDRDLILRLIRRGLIVLGMNIDPVTGAMSAGAFRQPPYGHSWPRDNAVSAVIMLRAGFRKLARRMLRFTASLQRPDGSFGGASYPTGYPWPLHEGLPLTYFGGQADGTGLFVWSVWDHFRHTRDRRFLEEMWPHIKAAADQMVAWRDPNGSHLASNEEDRILPGETIAGDAAFATGLFAAARVARTLGIDAPEAWSQRASEIIDALVPNYWVRDPGYFAWLTNPVVGGPYVVSADPGYDEMMWDHNTVVWPGKLLDEREPDKLRAHYDHVWREMWTGRPGRKLAIEPYNTGLAWLAMAYAELDARGILRDGKRRAATILTWVARHAAPTGIIGEVTTLDRPYPQSYASPHSWAHAFFIQAAVTTWME